MGQNTSNGAPAGSSDCRGCRGVAGGASRRLPRGLRRFGMTVQIFDFIGGAEEDRTPDLCSAIAALSHLSYGPGTSLRIYRGRLGLVNVMPRPVNLALAGAWPHRSSPRMAALCAFATRQVRTGGWCIS